MDRGQGQAPPEKPHTCWRTLLVEPLPPNSKPLSGLRKTLCMLANRCDRRGRRDLLVDGLCVL